MMIHNKHFLSQKSTSGRGSQYTTITLALFEHLSLVNEQFAVEIERRE